MNDVQNIISWIQQKINEVTGKNKIIYTYIEWFEINELKMNIRINPKYINGIKHRCVIEILSLEINFPNIINTKDFSNFLYVLEKSFPNNIIYITDIIDINFRNFLLNLNYEYDTDLSLYKITKPPKILPWEDE